MSCDSTFRYVCIKMKAGLTIKYKFNRKNEETALRQFIISYYKKEAKQKSKLPCTVS